MNCDPHYVLSFDRLHAVHGGLFQRHLWAEITKEIALISHGAEEILDAQYILNKIIKSIC